MSERHLADSTDDNRLVRRIQPSPMDSAVARLQSQALQVQQDLSQEVEERGWIGNSVDYIKSFAQPDQTSAAIDRQLDREQDGLLKLAEAAKTEDSMRFNRIYANLTGARFDPDRPQGLRSASALNEYKNSQQHWIDSTANGIAMVGGLLFTRKVAGLAAKSALSFTTANAITTGAIKTTLKLTDGQYSNPAYDFTSGAAAGALAVGSEAAGTAASIRLAKAYGLKTTTGSLSTAIVTEGQSLSIRYLGAFARFGVPYSVYSAASPWSQETINSLYYGRTFDTKHTALNSGIGLAAGLTGGTLLGFGMSKLPPALYGFFN